LNQERKGPGGCLKVAPGQAKLLDCGCLFWRFWGLRYTNYPNLHEGGREEVLSQKYAVKKMRNKSVFIFLTSCFD